MVEEVQDASSLRFIVNMCGVHPRPSKVPNRHIRWSMVRIY